MRGGCGLGAHGKPGSLAGELLFRQRRQRKSPQIADEAAEVYSARGLEAKATFMEATSNYDGAFDCFAKNWKSGDGDSDSVINFCIRYKSRIGDDRFEPEIKTALEVVPERDGKGIIRKFSRPANGRGADYARKRGRARQWIEAGDVIVAVYGTRMHNMKQYIYGRELKQTPELDLIVWHGGAYHEFKPSLPNHRFGVDSGIIRQSDELHHNTANSGRFDKRAIFIRL